MKQQLALQGDRFEAQTRLAQAEQQELTLRNQEATQKDQLNQLLGREVLAEFTIQPVSEGEGAELDLVAAASWPQPAT